MKTIQFPARNEWQALFKRPSIDTKQLEEKVEYMLNEVKYNGDEAIKRFSLAFDKVTIDELIVSEVESAEADNKVSIQLKAAIDVAFENIYRFHKVQGESEKRVETIPGVVCWRKSVPIEKIGLYVPGGTAPLFSTLLMLGIPAVIAGCKEISVCTPPDKNGKVSPVILYVAKKLGITNIYKVGGAQAVAAFAYGTKTIKRVDKIFGPGNQYVTSAKQLVASRGVAIDMPAGPSELAILADESCIPEFVAADLLSQAEHGTDSQVLLVSNSPRVLENVQEELNKQLEALPRKEFAAAALKNSKAVLVETLEEGMELLNEYAPEHLIIVCKNDEDLSRKVVNAGSVFLGNNTPESAGDYASGTNHTLPTNGYARAYSGVSLDSFMKKITFQKISEEGIKVLGPVIELMAEEEGLQAHKNAVTVRLTKNK